METKIKSNKISLATMLLVRTYRYLARHYAAELLLKFKTLLHHSFLVTKTFLAMETPFKLGAQFKRPNQGYAVDNLKNNFTFYMPVKRGLHARNHKRSCTFPSISKNLPVRQGLLHEHFDGEWPFTYSVEGRGITGKNERRTSKTLLKDCKRTLSMLL